MKSIFEILAFLFCFLLIVFYIIPVGFEKVFFNFGHLNPLLIFFSISAFAILMLSIIFIKKIYIKK